jgi:transcriptional regulator with XRE-family HTH domain
MKTLGERIRELREEKDTSLRELAEKLGLSAAFLSDVELGRRYPSQDVLRGIARALGVKAEDLRSHDTRPPVEEMKRRAASEPIFGFALRKVMERNVNTEDLLALAEKTGRKKKK